MGQEEKYISLISSRKYVTADNNYLFTIMNNNIMDSVRPSIVLDDIVVFCFPVSIWLLIRLPVSDSKIHVPPKLSFCFSLLPFCDFVHPNHLTILDLPYLPITFSFVLYHLYHILVSFRINDFQYNIKLL